MELDLLINNCVIAILGGIIRLIVNAQLFIFLDYKHQPRSRFLLLFALTGLIVVLMLSITLSPLKFNWPWFWGGVIVADLIVAFLSSLIASLIFWILSSPFWLIYFCLMWFLKVKKRLQRKSNLND
jgi:hypothetical protein